MRTRNFLAFVGAALFVASCSSISTSYDYDRTENFSKFKTYKWVMITGTTNQLSQNPFLEKQVFASVKNNLNSKGYVFKDSGDADFGVALHTSTQQQTQLDANGYGGYRGWGAGVGTATIDVNQYTVGTLIIDIVDMSTKQIAWRGLGTKDVTQYTDNAKGQQTVQNEINQILENFPPPPPTSSSK